MLTLRRLKALYPADKLYFIMGSDMLLKFSSGRVARYFRWRR